MSDIVCVRMNNLETADMNNFGAHGWGEKPYLAVYLCVCVSTPIYICIYYFSTLFLGLLNLKGPKFSYAISAKFKFAPIF